MSEELINIYEKYFYEKDREFIQLLDFIGDVGIQQVKKYSDGKQNHPNFCYF